MSGRSRVTRIGPYSRPGPLAKIDGRTREARFLKSIRIELVEHLGGRPSVTELALVERAVWISLRVAQLDAKMATAESFTDHDTRTYLAWANALARILRQLGLKPTMGPPRSLADVLAAGGKAA